MQNFPKPSPQIDSAELLRIKNNFALRERINSDRYELDVIERRSPTVFFSPIDQTSLAEGTLTGLKYPLELDGKGGLSLSTNYDRVGEQILEVLQTRFGERVYRPFFGIPELLFETIDESTLSQTIKSQIESSIPPGVELKVKVYLNELGEASIVVYYSVENSQTSIIKYKFTP